MTESLPPLSSAAPSPGPLQSLLDEAVTLAEDTRDYILADSGATADTVPSPDPLKSLRRSVALGHLTSRVAFAVAWLLGRRAVERGELTCQEATAPDWRLGGRHLELARRSEDDHFSPALHRLIERSAALHARIERLDSALD